VGGRRRRRTALRDAEEALAPALVVHRHPEQEVGEREVGEQLPLGDDALEVDDRGAGERGVGGEQVAQRRHRSPASAAHDLIQPSAGRAERPWENRLMSKRARQKRDRKKKASNHGKRPNS
jgi:hypothetical protein